ncbi:AbiV family abortive infection protein [Salinisphaera hydrothermalis]|uniref:AbiV family abortive infection protein n=1 Tax=Salinisphaera hydrothermalis TaxID=563188 RepID=UPI00333F4E07
MRTFEGDPNLGTDLLKSAECCFSNGSGLIEEAQLLLDGEKFSRSFALSILAQEEFSKCFLLSNCSYQGRWDQEVHKSLNYHEMKQAFVEVMLSYVQWFEAANSFALKTNVTALIPAPIKLLPDAAQWNRWIADAQKRVIKKKTIDRAKQREFYVAVDKDGRVSSKPNSSDIESKAQIEKSKKFKYVAKLQMDEARRAVSRRKA